MSAVVLPNYVSGSETESSVLPSRQTINRTSRSINQTKQIVAAQNMELGPVYGETMVGGKVDIIKEVGNYLYLRAQFCLGTVHEVVSVSINDTEYAAGNYDAHVDYQGDWSASTTWDIPHDLPYSAQIGEIYRLNGSYYRVKETFNIEQTTGIYTPANVGYSSYFEPLISNADVNVYRGLPGQGIDPLMVEAIPSYTETLTGQFLGYDFQVCYAVIKIARASYTGGFPRATAIIKGMEVLDHRTNVTVYSDNPALCYADFLQSPLYGFGYSVNSESVIHPANYCDDAFVDGARSSLNLEITGVQSTQNWAETLRAYAYCFATRNNGEYQLVANAPRTTDTMVSFNSNDLSHAMELASIPRRSWLDLSDRPNLVRVRYTDPSDWSEHVVEVQSAALLAGHEIARISDIRLPGLHTIEQATRMANHWLLVAEYEAWKISLDVYDAGINVLPGYVIEVSAPNAIDQKLIRVLTRKQTGLGRYEISGQQYSNRSYETVV